MSIEWISVSNERPQVGEQVILFVRGGYAIGKLTSHGWVYFNGFTEEANPDGTLTQYNAGDWPPEYWAPLTRP